MTLKTNCEKYNSSTSFKFCQNGQRVSLTGWALLGSAKGLGMIPGTIWSPGHKGKRASKYHQATSCCLNIKLSYDRAKGERTVCAWHTSDHSLTLNTTWSPEQEHHQEQPENPQNHKSSQHRQGGLDQCWHQKAK